MTKRALCLVLLAACTNHYDDDAYDPGYGSGSGSGSGSSTTPMANDDHEMLAEDESLSAATLMANDQNVTLLKVIDGPSHGWIDSYSAYHPDPGYFGVDQFTYEGRYGWYGSFKSTAKVYLLIHSDDIPYETSRLLSTKAATAIDSGDLDGDGKIDLVTCTSSANEMTIYRNTTTAPGAYTIEPHVFEGGTKPHQIVVADIDGDGKRDIVTATDDGVTLFRNITVGPLAFEGPLMLAPGTAIAAVVIADLDGDAQLDIAAVEDRWYYGDLVHTWLNKSTAGSFSFGADATFASPDSPKELSAVDADRDGRADLAVLANGKLAILVNTTASGAALAELQNWAGRDTGPSPRHMFLADLDGNGSPEIGVLHDSGALWIYANRGTTSPSFEAARVLALGTVKLVRPVPLDDDAQMDLVGVATGSTGAPLQLLTNTSQPQMFDFDAAAALPGDVESHREVELSAPTGFIYVDLDGVAPLEIVVAQETGGYPQTPGLRVLYGP